MINNELLKVAADLREMAFEFRQEDRRAGIFPDHQTANELEKFAERIAALSSPIDKGETKPHFDHLAVHLGEGSAPRVTAGEPPMMVWVVSDNEGTPDSVYNNLEDAEEQAGIAAEELSDFAPFTVCRYVPADLAAQSGREAPTNKD